MVLIITCLVNLQSYGSQQDTTESWYQEQPYQAAPRKQHEARQQQQPSTKTSPISQLQPQPYNPQATAPSLYPYLQTTVISPVSLQSASGQQDAPPAAPDIPGKISLGKKIIKINAPGQYAEQIAVDYLGDPIAKKVQSVVKSSYETTQDYLSSIYNAGESVVSGVYNVGARATQGLYDFSAGIGRGISGRLEYISPGDRGKLEAIIALPILTKTLGDINTILENGINTATRIRAKNNIIAMINYIETNITHDPANILETYPSLQKTVDYLINHGYEKNGESYNSLIQELAATTITENTFLHSLADVRTKLSNIADMTTPNAMTINLEALRIEVESYRKKYAIRLGLELSGYRYAAGLGAAAAAFYLKNYFSGQ